MRPPTIYPLAVLPLTCNYWVAKWPFYKKGSLLSYLIALRYLIMWKCYSWLNQVFCNLSRKCHTLYSHTFLWNDYRNYRNIMPIKSWRKPCQFPSKIAQFFMRYLTVHVVEYEILQPVFIINFFFTFVIYFCHLS